MDRRLTPPPAPLADRHILVVTGSLAVGGTEKHLARVLPGLKARGWRITIFVLTEEGELAAGLRRAGIDIISVSGARRLIERPTRARRLLRLAVSSWHLIRTMRRLRPAVTHFFLPEAYIVGAICARLARLDTLVMSRRSLNHYQAKRIGIRRLERWLHRSMTMVLGNSRAVVDDLLAEGIEPQRLALIHNGIELLAASPGERRTATRSELGVPEGCLVLIAVANLIPYKGHLDLIAALASLPTVGDWRLVCVGRDDGHGAALRAAATDAGIADRIQWLGSRGDVDALFAAADIGVLPSHEEGFSNALIEGMAAGLPMIATTVGGNAEAIRDGETGLLVPPRAPQRLAAAIAALAADPARRAEIGRAARQVVREHFSLERCIAEYDALYARLSSRTRKAAAADLALQQERS